MFTILSESRGVQWALVNTQIAKHKRTFITTDFAIQSTYAKEFGYS